MGQRLETVQCAGGIVVFPDTTILLIERPNGWAIPKGHVERTDKSAEHAAIREVREETGYQAEIIAMLGQLTRASKERDGRFVNKAIAVYLMRGLLDKAVVPDEIPRRVSIDAALDNMHFQEEAAFLADHADDILGHFLRLVS